ncbi:MAG: type CRISPR-associated helicase/endonuclease Cas3, partial [Planctomycetaceae bacterium]|nr:type CRISPR-associated helicase/endonuclease Cas3 [Planctomycetaceae bacterium]
LIALANQPEKMPRRLVYVVNRRTVVDQTTNEVEKIRARLNNSKEGVVKDIAESLIRLSGNPLTQDALAVSTLRGQFADNREWSADPSRPAVIVGTVDMIGSRLLFSGYGIGFKSKPLHAGFLGQDVLLIHDEAHLEPAFQQLLIRMQHEQERCKEFRPFRVMELSATSRAGKEVFSLTDEDRANHEVAKRIGARKAISLHELDEERRLAETIVELAQGEHTKDRAVLIFVRKVDDVEKIVKQLPKGATQQLTGTLRGFERDSMADPRKEKGCGIFARFLKPPKPNADELERWKVEPQPGTVYLVCTSAGEVGVNISADHLVCDLSTFESMAQRFGRVNRFGEHNDTEMHIVHPTSFDENGVEARRANTLEIIKKLNGDGSPQSLSEIPLQQRIDAFAPEPTILPTTNILFDAWSLTTIKDKLPGRPDVGPYLHGIEDDSASETLFAWREEVDLLTGRVGKDDVEELLDQVRLKPHELLRVTTYGKGRAYDQLQKISDRNPKSPIWIIEPDGTLVTDKIASDLVTKRGADYAVSLAARTVILSPRAGGLTAIGTLDGSEAFSAERQYDVAGVTSEVPLLRFKVSADVDGHLWLKPVTPIKGISNDFRAELGSVTNRYRELNSLFRQLELPPTRPKFSLKLTTPSNEDDETGVAIQEYLILQQILPRKESEAVSAWPTLKNHLDGVGHCASVICKQLNLNEELTRAIEHSGAWHDLGKGRAVWQRGAGNEKAHITVAKTIHGRPPENLNRYRHELGSLIDVCGAADFAKEFEDLSENQRDIVLHLIASHHGRARPHFPEIEAVDMESPSDLVKSVMKDVPSRFARLQRKYGRWGLAYLESILRAADILDSQRIDAASLGDPVPGEWPKPSAKVLRFPLKPNPPPGIRIKIDLTNPGQFFACCGLLELADRLWPGAEAWFEKGTFLVHCEGSLTLLLDALVNCAMTNTMTEAQHARYKEISAWSGVKRNSASGVEDEYKGLGKLLREAPIVLRAPFDITLDWFVDIFAGGSRFKTWAGQQSVLGIATSMKDALKVTTWRNEDCLTYAARECGLPFNFDSDLGGQGGAIDVGFSFDPLAGSALTRIESMARPALELLAFIGLQRFRPKEFNGENRFLYTAWNRPLPIEVATPAACGVLPIVGSDQYEFRLLYRTKYLKSFLPAIPFSGDSDE